MGEDFFRREARRRTHSKILDVSTREGYNPFWSALESFRWISIQIDTSLPYDVSPKTPWIDFDFPGREERGLHHRLFVVLAGIEFLM